MVDNLGNSNLGTVVVGNTQGNICVSEDFEMLNGTILELYCKWKTEKDGYIDLSALVGLKGLSICTLIESPDFKTPVMNITSETLKTLKINTSKVTNLDFLCAFPNLESLTITDSLIGNIEGILNCPNLKSINLNNNSIVDLSCLTRKNGDNYILSKLEKIELKNNVLEGVALNYIVELHNNAVLKTVELAGNNNIIDWSKISGTKGWDDRNKRGWN